MRLIPIEPFGESRRETAAEYHARHWKEEDAKELISDVACALLSSEWFMDMPEGVDIDQAAEDDRNAYWSDCDTSAMDNSIDELLSKREALNK